MSKRNQKDLGVEAQYLDLLRNVLNKGVKKSDRTGVGTISLFAPPKIDFYLADGFPLMTTRKVAWKNTVRELVWMLSGSTNVNDLPEQTKKWWSPWAKENGDLGPIYGKLWREWPYGDKTVDQVNNVINSIKHNPDSRRHIISTWHPGEIENQMLPPCHGLIIQYYVDRNNLSCFVHQRSCDCAIGAVANLPSYSLLLMIIANICGLYPYRVSYSFGDAHIYLNHISGVEEQLKRTMFKLPSSKINKKLNCIEDFCLDNVVVDNYVSHDAIKFELAV